MRLRAACSGLVRTRSGGLTGLLIVLLVSLAGRPAHAQLIDRISAFPAPGGEVEILLHTYSDVLYQRHAPPAAGTELRIYLRVSGAEAGAGGRERLAAPPSRFAPRFRLSYPENDGSLLVTFETKTAYRVSQARGPRGISIFVPAPPQAGAKPADGNATLPANGRSDALK